MKKHRQKQNNPQQQNQTKNLTNQQPHKTIDAIILIADNDYLNRYQGIRTNQISGLRALNKRLMPC